ncbi:MAG: hypothetical protein ACO2ER_15710 [Castellaniella sp.]
MATDDITLDELANFGPMITDDQVDQLEHIATSQGIGQGRRLVLLALSRSADTLSDFSAKEPEAFAEMLEIMEQFQEHVEGLSKMVESAMLRVQIADCRNN